MASEVAVAATDWYCVELQTEIGKHWRSDTYVGAILWNWLAVHGVRLWQVRSVVRDGATVWYWLEPHGELTDVQLED